MDLPSPAMHRPHKSHVSLSNFALHCNCNLNRSLVSLSLFLSPTLARTHRYLERERRRSPERAPPSILWGSPGTLHLHQHHCSCTSLLLSTFHSFSSSLQLFIFNLFFSSYFLFSIIYKSSISLFGFGLFIKWILYVSTHFPLLF